MARRLIALLVAVALAGCAEPAPPTLEVGSLEASLPASIWPDDPMIVTDVDCPDLDDEIIAQTTTCTALLDGAAVTVDVEIAESLDGEAATTATVRETLFVVTDAAGQLAARLESDLGLATRSVTVECVRVVIVAQPDAEISCVATRAGDELEFTVVLLDAAGTWEPRYG